MPDLRRPDHYTQAFTVPSGTMMDTLHPRASTEPLLVDTCACLRASGHGYACLCRHGFERQVYRVDDDGREHYVARPPGEE
jgi:hypothetical protein